MEEPSNLDLSNLKLQNGISLAELSTGSEFELQKEDNFYEIPEDTKLNKEQLDRIYDTNSFTDEEDITEIDLASTSFEKIAENMQDLTKDGGVLKKLLKRGHGPFVAKDSVVHVHYNAYFEYSDEPFDSSHLRSQSFKYKMGTGRAIPGWEIALLTMNKGEKSRFLIKPEYGFREMGCPPRVPQNATALFVIELLTLSDEIGIDVFYLLDEDERSKINFDWVNKLVHSEKTEGSKFFSQNLFKKAFNKYKQAVNLLESCHLKSDEEEKECERLLVSLNLNLALCCLRLTHSPRAITFCRKVLNSDKNNPKALFRLGQAFHQLKNFDEAQQYLRKAKNILPNDSSIDKELKQVEENKRKFKFMEANIYKKMVSSIETKTNNTSTKELINSQNDPVSKEFQDSVIIYLQNFIDDTCQDECPFSTYSMSEAEMNFVLEAVDNMDLDVVQTGSGQNSYIRISKKKQQLQDDQIVLT